MREITTHKSSLANNDIRLHAEPELPPGMASHVYCIAGPTFGFTLNFQNGPIKEAGVNGITDEVLIAVCIDRLQGFQSGPYKCRHNAIALTKLEEALLWLQSRTRSRAERGVEGTHAV